MTHDPSALFTVELTTFARSEHVASSDEVIALRAVAVAARACLNHWEGAACIVSPPCGGCLACDLATALRAIDAPAPATSPPPAPTPAQTEALAMRAERDAARAETDRARRFARAWHALARGYYNYLDCGVHGAQLCEVALAHHARNERGDPSGRTVCRRHATEMWIQRDADCVALNTALLAHATPPPGSTAAKREEAQRGETAATDMNPAACFFCGWPEEEHDKRTPTSKRGVCPERCRNPSCGTDGHTDDDGSFFHLYSPRTDGDGGGR